MGVNASTAVQPSGPATASCGTLLGISYVSPAPSSRFSPPTVKTIEPWRMKPSCSFSWRCSLTLLLGFRSTTARVMRRPLTTRANTPSATWWGRSPASGRQVSLNFAVDDRRRAQAAAAAHGLQAVTSVAALELDEQAGHQDRA